MSDNDAESSKRQTTLTPASAVSAQAAEGLVELWAQSYPGVRIGTSAQERAALIEMLAYAFDHLDEQPGKFLAAASLAQVVQLAQEASGG